MVSDSYILIPSQTIVNKEAIGGNQAAKVITAVEAAAISTTSLVESTSHVISSLK
jgi:hypothetical protein